MTVVGIDTHKDTLAACAVDDAGRALEHRSFANTPAGHAELACWVTRHEAMLVAMEGSGLYGRPAAGVLADADFAVVEVPPHMTAAARRRQRTGSKTDPGDALAIARVSLREPALPPPRPHGAIEEMRCVVRYRRELIADRTRQINRLHADLEQRRPGYHQHVGRLSTTAALDRAARLLRGDTASRALIARNRIKALRSLQRVIDSLTAEIRAAVDATGTTLREIDGIGHLTAADILTEVGDPARFRTKAAFAMANGTAPIDPETGLPIDPRTGEPFDPEELAAMQEQLREAQEQLVSVPAAEIVQNHMMGLFELAALHLQRDPPDLTEARLPIDALGLLVDNLADQLPAGDTLRGALQQIRLAYVEIHKRQTAGE